MLTILLWLLIAIIVICVIAGVVLWAVGAFLSQARPPARLVVVGVALVAILYALLRVVQGGLPGLSF